MMPMPVSHASMTPVRIADPSFPGGLPEQFLEAGVLPGAPAFGPGVLGALPGPPVQPEDVPGCGEGADEYPGLPLQPGGQAERAVADDDGVPGVLVVGVALARVRAHVLDRPRAAFQRGDDVEELAEPDRAGQAGEARRGRVKHLPRLSRGGALERLLDRRVP